MSAPTCPECRTGKHGNCDGTAWDVVRDEPTGCECERRGHLLTAQAIIRGRTPATPRRLTDYSHAPDGCHDGSGTEADAGAFAHAHRSAAEEPVSRYQQALDDGYEPERGAW